MQPDQREIPDLIDYAAFPTDANPSMLYVPDIPERMPVLAYILAIGATATGYFVAIVSSYFFGPYLDFNTYGLAVIALFLAEVSCVILSCFALAHYAMRLSSNPDISRARSETIYNIPFRWSKIAASNGTLTGTCIGPIALFIFFYAMLEVFISLPHAFMPSAVAFYLITRTTALYLKSGSFLLLVSDSEAKELEACFAVRRRTLIKDFVKLFRCWFQPDYEGIPNAKPQIVRYRVRLVWSAVTIFLLALSLCWFSCFFCFLPTLPNLSHDYWLTTVTGPAEVSQEVLDIFHLLAEEDRSREHELKGDTYDEFSRLVDHRRSILISPSGWMTTVSGGSPKHMAGVLIGWVTSLFLTAIVVPLTFIGFVCAPMVEPLRTVAQIGDPTLSDGKRWINTVRTLYLSDCPYERESIYLGDYDGPEYATIKLEGFRKQ